MHCRLPVGSAQINIQTVAIVLCTSCNCSEKSDRPQNLKTDQRLSDINRYQETETAQTVNYQRSPTYSDEYTEPHLYQDIANTAIDTNTANNPYEELDIERQQPPVYRQLANRRIS